MIPTAWRYTPGTHNHTQKSLTLPQNISDYQMGRFISSTMFLIINPRRSLSRRRAGGGRCGAVRGGSTDTLLSSVFHSDEHNDRPTPTSGSGVRGVQQRGIKYSRRIQVSLYTL